MSGRVAITITIQNEQAGGDAPTEDLSVSPIPAEKAIIGPGAPTFHLCLANLDLADDLEVQKLFDLLAISANAEVSNISILLRPGSEWRDLWFERLTKISDGRYYHINVINEKGEVTHCNYEVKGNRNIEEMPQSIEVCIFPTYNGRREIISMAKRLLDSKLPAQDLTPSVLSQFHSLGQMPECDLIVFFGPEQSLSNGPLWSAAYAEFEFLGASLADVDPSVYTSILSSFSQRERRFGALTATPKEGGVA